MEFNDDYPQYEILAQHSEEEGKVKRKKLWRVFWIMLGITILELIIGFQAESMGLLDSLKFSTITLKIIFVGLTIVKAAYIVMEFMHLGHERKALKYTIIAPYVLFVSYLIWIIIVEGTYAGTPERKPAMSKLIIEQQSKIRTGDSHHEEGTEHSTAPVENAGEEKHEEKSKAHH